MFLPIRNNILSQNDTNISIIAGAVSQTTIDHNLFYGDGSVMGTDIVVGDPKFRNPSAGDFYLQSGSPAIDAGSSSGAPSKDFEGSPDLKVQVMISAHMNIRRRSYSIARSLRVIFYRSSVSNNCLTCSRA